MKRFLPIKISLAVSVLLLFLFFAKNVSAACTQVGSNQTTCSGTQSIACSQQLPTLGRINRYCCDTQQDCNNTKSGVQQQITQQLAPSSVKPIPKIYLPCDKTDDPEFHSLRPYQAAPCGTANKALFCSNTLTFVESFDHFPSCKSQAPRPGGCSPGEYPFICHDPAEGHVDEHNLIVDLDNSMFPIMGNTEQVKNSTNTTDSLDDATKVNEYVSWYLHGVNNKAENGQDKNTPNEAINFSGPIQKLMPGVIQDAQRIQTIANVSTLVPRDPEGEGKPGLEQATHNQIVVCSKKLVQLVPLWLTNFLGIGSIGFGNDIPIECYPSPNSKAKGTVKHLGDWTGGSLVYTISSLASQYIPQIFPSGTLSQLVAQLIAGTLNHWPKNYPPLPWADEYGKPFATALDYQKAYNEWRGQACTFIDILGGRHLICAGAWPLISNPFADLYPYVPLANTTDKVGLELLTPPEPSYQPSSGVTITPPQHGPIINALLYFAHTEEVKNLSEFLNSSYTPKGVTSVPLPKTTETNNCSAVNVRANQGDNLFPGQRPDPKKNGIQIPKLTYTITEVPCVLVVTQTNDQPPRCNRNVICHADITITMKTSTKTPWANEIFSSTVADSGSTFRRIYPKVEPGAPVSCIADIPTVTNVTYDENRSVRPPYGGGTGDLSFNVGNLPSDGGATPDSPQLTFPHIGSVYEYFLKGIQTALRPQGYGEPTPISGTLCVSSQAGGDCSFNTGLIGQAIQRAAAKYGVPSQLLKSIYEIESADEIANPSSYQCRENSATAAGVTQITRSAYEAVTCPNERLPNDIGVCSSQAGKLSRCNIDNAFELEARVLLWKAGKLNGCSPTGGLSIPNKIEWYKAACNYYGTSDPNDETNKYANEIPASERRPGGMSYCDIVCWKMGQCPPYPAR